MFQTVEPESFSHAMRNRTVGDAVNSDALGRSRTLWNLGSLGKTELLCPCCGEKKKKKDKTASNYSTFTRLPSFLPSPALWWGLCPAGCSPKHSFCACFLGISAVSALS